MNKIRLYIAALAAFAGSVVNTIKGQGATYFANIAEGIHDANVSRVADAAITTRHLLYKKGAADNSVAVNAAANTLPIGVVSDEITAEEISNGVQVSLQLLGKGPTKRMVAAKAIAVGVRVATAASGKVTDTITTGNYLVGFSVTAAGADGDIIEVADHPPILIP